MRTYRWTFTLVGFFFAGLLTLWWLDYAGVPTERERRMRLNRILPDLIDTSESAVSRVEMSRGNDRLVLERRGKDRWQMREPLDVAAEPSTIETLLRNLKDLRRSPDAGAITGPAESYGLAPPENVIKLFGGESAARDEEPRLLAALEIGKTLRDVSYVRP